MRSKVLIGCLVFVCLSMPAAHAGQTFEWFQKLCVANHADTVPVLAAADAAGWMTMPKSILESVSKNSQFENVEGRILSNDKAFQFLLQGMGRFSFAPNITFRICGVALVADPPVSMEAESEAFAGVPRFHGQNSGAVWLWKEENGQHVGFNYKQADADTMASFASGGVEMLFTTTSDKISMVILAIPMAAPPK